MHWDYPFSLNLAEPMHDQQVVSGTVSTAGAALKTVLAKQQDTVVKNPQRVLSLTLNVDKNALFDSLIYRDLFDHLLVGETGEDNKPGDIIYQHHILGYTATHVGTQPSYYVRKKSDLSLHPILKQLGFA